MNDRASIITDEMLYAWLDGELDAAQAASVSAAVETDVTLAQRVARQRALRAQLQSRFAPVIEEPIPERLLATIAAPPAGVVDLNQVRATRSSPAARRPAWQEWGAIAATLVLGVLAGSVFFQRGNEQPYTLDDGQMLARGELQRALSEQISGTSAQGKVAIGLSAHTNAGEICRSFALESGPAGLACRRGSNWVIDVLAGTNAAHGDYRQATTAMPENLRLALESRMTGEPLTPEEEATARAKDWRE
jgi:hypothetical protein